MTAYQATRYPIYLVCVMFLVFLLGEAGYDFSVLGVYPRRVEGLVGLVFGPLIHGNGSHLLSNAVPILVLGTALWYFYPTAARTVWIWVYLGSGSGVWLFGRSEGIHGSRLVHIGASGLVYGLAAFLVASGAVRRQPRAIAIALAVYFLYSGMIQGLFPFAHGISWEGHLSGSVVGIGLAIWLRRKDSEKPLVKSETNSDSGYRNLETPYFKYHFKPHSNDK